MGRLLDKLEIDYEIGIDEAAFYGPKLDIQCKNVFGKEDTIVTIQIDMLLAKKFGMEYVDSENKLVNPYIIHRTSMGCYERTLALLLEKYAGALPMWLSPTQATVIPVNADMNAYAAEITAKMESCGIRVRLDDRNETMGKRIREAQIEKIPYMLIVGGKEQETNSVSVRTRKGEDLGAMPVDEMLAKFTLEIATKAK